MVTENQRIVNTGANYHSRARYILRDYWALVGFLCTLSGKKHDVITRFDKLQMELPHPKHPSANSAAAVQELLGGKFGEMSTFMNYTFQSFNFRGRSEMRPFYDLIANIAA